MFRDIVGFGVIHSITLARRLDPLTVGVAAIRQQGYRKCQRIECCERRGGVAREQFGGRGTN